jgi:NAD(P)-dependent dehydrogenase (short-subunit alcohol dehydrogenase family)
MNNVIITGASRGIGKSIALTLARDFPKRCARSTSPTNPR